MDDAEKLLQATRKTIYGEPPADITKQPLRLRLESSDLIIEGDVANIAAKKLVLERAASVPGIRGIVDRLRVTPAEKMGDDAIRDAVRDALVEEAALSTCAIYAVDKGKVTIVETPPSSAGEITIAVADGVVTLDGDVPGLAYKRLAGVLTWWVPGVRDVVNGLGVTPPETDSDEEMTDAVRMALEKDPFVNADQILVSTRESVVTLHGLVPTPSEREMAEFDAWYVFGVDKVVNEIKVHP